MLNPSPLLLFILQATPGQPTFGQPQLNADTCVGASQSFLLTCLTVDLVVVLACVGLKLYWNRRLVAFWVSLLVPLILAFLISFAVVTWAPLKSEMLLDCLQSPQFMRFVTMGNATDVARGLVLGGLVSAGLYFLILIVLGLVTGAKKKRGKP